MHTFSLIVTHISSLQSLIAIEITIIMTIKIRMKKTGPSVLHPYIIIPQYHVNYKNIKMNLKKIMLLPQQ